MENLVGDRCGGAAKFSQNLMNLTDNDHIHLHEERGFGSDDLVGTFHEAYGVSYDTRCKKFLYSVSLPQPKTEHVPIDVFATEIEQIKRNLGLQSNHAPSSFMRRTGAVTRIWLVADKFSNYDGN